MSVLDETDYPAWDRLQKELSTLKEENERLKKELASAVKECIKLRKLRNDLVNTFQHVHKAKTVNTELVDECLECGLHWRNPVHRVV